MRNLLAPAVLTFGSTSVGTLSPMLPGPTCPTCAGSGEGWNPRRGVCPCPACGGSGVVRSTPATR